MADRPINLNRARKARTRLNNARQADENAAKFGRTKAEKAQDLAQAKLTRSRLEAHRREDPPEPGTEP